jgi:hypothetical protein
VRLQGIVTMVTVAGMKTSRRAGWNQEKALAGSCG